MTEALLRIRDLRVRFPGAAADAVAGLDLDLAPGQALALVGASGCGKTATARAITGLHPEGTRVGGSVGWRGTDLRTLAAAALRRRLGTEIATVFQDAGASLNPVVRVGDQLVEIIRLHSKAGRDDAGGLRDALFGEVRLDAELARRYPHQLSGGEQQRVALALALAGDPDLLIADEPTTALDPHVQQEIVTLLRSLAERRSMALLFITHDLGLAGRVAERVAVMAAGRVVEEGVLAQVVAAPESEAARELVAAYGAGPRASARADTDDAATHAADGLVVDGLSVRRRGAARPALDGISFRLARGEAFGLVGASGSGKTTLARALAGFLESGGGIHPPPCGRAGPRPIQMIFQSPAAALDPRRDILTSVGDAAAAAGSDDPGSEARELLREVGFPAGMETRRPHALSGGQRQRAVIARALAARPEVVVADEPASSLDLPARQDLVDVLDRIRALRGIVLVLISHDLRLVQRCCGRVGILDAGELVEIVLPGERPESAVGREIWLASSSFPPGPPESRPQPCE